MAQRFSGLLTNNALKMCMSNVPKFQSNAAASNVGTGTGEQHLLFYSETKMINVSLH
jgi:hypothetical protein